MGTSFSVDHLVNSKPSADYLVDSKPSADHLVDFTPSAFLTSSHFDTPSPDFLQGLPKGTVNHAFVDIRDLQELVGDQSDLLDNDKSRNQYLRFSRVPPEEFQKIFEDPNLIGKSSRVLYDKKGNLIIKITSSKGHEQASRMFWVLFGYKIMKMDLFFCLSQNDTTTTNYSDFVREPDGSWGLLTSPSPSLVLEVGLSESAARLVADAKWWLETDGSEVRMVVTIEIYESIPKIVIQRWEQVQVAHPVTGTASARQKLVARPVEEATISWPKNATAPNNKTTVNGTITLPFQNVFLRPQDPARPLERDIHFNQLDLLKLADRVWRRQGFTR
jgi:hypothetical protein